MISSQLEIIEQAKAFLCELSQFEYQQKVEPHLSSSAGAHMRHIVDHYQALRHGVVTGEVDYNLRNRDSDVENDPQQALAVWKDIEKWLRQISTQDMDKAITVKSEVSINAEQTVSCVSSLGRELMFVASHAIHHYSLLAVIRSLQGGKNDATFGVAPATATYRREAAAAN
jgi:hypothetical protein